jgi:ABC-2 type transport system permease protein
MSAASDWQSFADAWRAEWTKARTVSSTGWLLASTVFLSAGVSAAVCAVVHYQAGGGQDPAKLALSGVQLAQALIAIWAVRAVTGEYRSGMILTTLTAMPQRHIVLAAKTAVIAALALAASTVTVVGSLVVACALLAGNGFTAVHRLPLALGSGAALRAASGSVLYLGLIGLLATGTALAVRHSAAATGTVLGFLYLFPLATQLAGSATWQRHLEQIGPTTAGLNIQATTNLRALPGQPWEGLAVLAAWAVGTIFIGSLVFCLRDA